MHSNHKINILLGTIAAIIFLGLAHILHDDFDHLSLLLKERKADKEVLFDEVLRMRNDPVRHLVMDYSYWDDMVKFIASPNDQWARDNIDTSFSTYHYNALWIYRNDNRLIHSVYINGNNEIKNRAFPLPLNKILPLFTEEDTIPHFFIETEHGLLEINGAKIHSPKDGNKLGKSYGYLLAGVLWDDKYIAELAQLTRSRLTLKNPAEIVAEAAADPRQGFLNFSRNLNAADGTLLKTLDITVAMPDIRLLLKEMDHNAVIGTALMIVLITLVIIVLVSRQRLKNANMNLDAAQQTANMGSWQREVENGVISWSDNLYRIFGLPVHGSPPSLETFYSLVHPDDRLRMRELIELAAKEKSGYEAEFHIVRPDGQIRFMRTKGEVFLVHGSQTRIVGSTQDITERTAIQQELSALIQQKDAFITRLGHDLKTPLTPLLILLPLIRDRITALDPELWKMTDICHKNANYISGLTAKTLQLARLTTKVTPGEMQNIDLATAADGYLQNSKEAIERKKISCENAIPPGLIVRAVPVQLEELFTNLISNATGFSPVKGHIRISAEQKKQTITVSVSDSGVGLEHDQLERIFDEFYKTDESRHDLNSPGLGLSICKRIVSNHNGKIWAESPGKGMGTTVMFTLPCASIY